MKRLRLLLGLALVLAAAVTACGDGTKSEIAHTTTTSTAPPASAEATTTTAAPSSGKLEISAAPWQLPAPVSREVLLTDGTSLFVLGGLNAGKTSVAAVNRIDPATGKSEEVASLDPPVHDAAGVADDGKYFVIGGGTPPIRTTVQAVQPGGATSVAGNIPEPRADHVATRVDKTIYALGGGDEASHLVQSVVASDDGATWRQAGTLAEPVRYPAIAVVSGAIYLFGGVSSSEGTDTASVQKYDPGSGTTTVVGKLPAPLSHASAVVLGGRVYVLGGFVNNQVTAQVLAFEPGSGAITQAGSLPAAVTDAAAVTIGDKGYLAGGQGTDRAPVASVTILHV
jgi:serine/threonine-protein kinase PknK